MPPGLAFCPQISDSEVHFCLLRLVTGDQESKRVKFVYITHIGQSVGGVAKGRAAAHRADVERLLGQSHLSFQTDDVDDLDEVRLALQTSVAAERPGRDELQGWEARPGVRVSRPVDLLQSRGPQRASDALSCPAGACSPRRRRSRISCLRARGPITTSAPTRRATRPTLEVSRGSTCCAPHLRVALVWFWGDLNTIIVLSLHCAASCPHPLFRLCPLFHATPSGWCQSLGSTVIRLRRVLLLVVFRPVNRSTCGGGPPRRSGCGRSGSE